MAAANSVDSCVETHVSIAGEEFKEENERTTMVQRAQWLRAAILGAIDGLLSTTSLMLGVGAANDDKWLMIISGIAGAIAGACSMAVGEFVSVSTQRDIEQATFDKCKLEAAAEASRINGDTYHVKPRESTPVHDMFTPAQSPFTRVIVPRNQQEIPELLPIPYKAAGASWLAFLCGSMVPLLSALAFHVRETRVVAIVILATLALAAFGAFGAHLGALPIKVSTLRVVLGGWLSMALTYGALKPFDKDH